MSVRVRVNGRSSVRVRVFSGGPTFVGAGDASQVPLNPAIPGLGGTVQSAVTALKEGQTPKEIVFGDSDLSLAGVLVASLSGFSITPSSVEVWQPSGSGFEPIYGNIETLSSVAVAIDLSDFRPLPAGCVLKVLR